MAKKRMQYVTVAGRTYGPDDEMSAEVEKQITNEKVFAESGDPVLVDPASAVDAEKARAADKRASSKGE